MKCTRPDDGFEYYAYMLLYVDDVLCIHHDAMAQIARLDKYFQMKKPYGDVDMYLGSKVRKCTMPNGVEAWGLSPAKYIKASVDNVKQYLAPLGLSLPKRAPTPFPSGYDPDTDASDLASEEEASYMQQQIGVLRWIVELGRIDIITEVSCISSMVAMPRKGHLEAIYHIYGYLDKKPNSRIILDPSYPEVDMSDFYGGNWEEFYGDVEEPMPPNAPPPLGNPVTARLYTDSDLAGCKKTRRSRSGHILMINTALISAYSKKQATIETSVYGSEFLALKTGMEASRGLRYKLRMMGIPVLEPTYTYVDNMSVVHNSSRPESTLKKKSNSIAYNYCRESCAMGEHIVGHISTNCNPADICTKIMPGGIKRDGIVSLLLWDINDDHSKPDEEEKK
jgi:hypothetical protein